MKIEIEIPDRIITDTIISGLEGGISYWGYAIKRSKDELTLTIIDDDGDKEFKLTLESWPLAIHRMFTGITHDGRRFTRRHFTDMVGENGDATTGDVLIQLACFGEVKYGG